MNDLQIAWAKRQKQYINDLQSDLDHITRGSDGYCQNEKLEKVEIEVKK